MQSAFITYHRIHLVPDCSFGIFDGLPSTNQADLALDVGPRRLGNIDLASGRGLHILDGLAAFKQLVSRGFSQE